MEFEDFEDIYLVKDVRVIVFLISWRRIVFFLMIVVRILDFDFLVVLFEVDVCGIVFEVIIYFKLNVICLYVYILLNNIKFMFEDIL